MVEFGEVEPFLYCNEDNAPVTKAKFLMTMRKNLKLKMELAIIVHYGEISVKKNYL